MSNLKYNISDIKVGDEVIFTSTKLQSNYDEYWEVVGIENFKIMIQLNRVGLNEYWTIDINEVIGHISINK